MAGPEGSVAATGGDTGPDYADRVRALLHRRGLRCTTARLAVLEVLVADHESGHLSAAQIHRSLLDTGREVDVTTVYRTVSTLIELGVLHALTVDERVTTYGLADWPHHHAVCTRCAAIIEIPADRLTSALAHASAGSAFTLSDTAGLTLRGLCPQCQ